MRNFDEVPVTLTEQLGMLQYLRDLVNAQGIREDVRPIIVQSIINVFVQQPAVGTCDAISIVDGAMEYFFGGDGVSAGVSLSEGISEYTFFSQGLSVGTSSVVAQVEYTAHSVGDSVGGVDYIAGIIEASISAVGLSETLFDVAAISEPAAQSIGNADGTATATAVGETGRHAVGTSTSTSAVDASSQFLGIADGMAAGAATVSGVGSAILYGAGTAAGAATVSGVGSAILYGVGASSGTATVAAEGAIIGSFYRSHTELTPSQSRSNSSFNKPTGTLSGDTLVMYVFIYGASHSPVPTVTAPTGFSNIGTQPVVQFADGVGTTGGIYAFYKIAGGSEPSSYATTHTSNVTEGILYCVGGGYGGIPAVVGTTGTGTSVSAGPITTKNKNAFVMEVAAVWDDATADLPPTNYTQRYDPITPVNGVYAADRVYYSSSGSTGAITAEFSGNFSFSPWGAVLVDVESGEYSRAGVAAGTATVAAEGVAV